MVPAPMMLQRYKIARVTSKGSDWFNVICPDETKFNVDVSDRFGSPWHNLRTESQFSQNCSRVVTL